VFPILPFLVPKVVSMRIQLIASTGQTGHC
jgi:hypothetical protein